MASVKNIKKDIDYLVDEVISDSLLCISMQPVKNKENFIEIINQTVEMRNNLISKVNSAPRIAKRSEMKAYYKAIYDELISNADKSFEKLSKLIESK
jgi:hypothetical protein